MQRSAEITPFRVAVPQHELDDLHERLSRVRWCNELPDAGWDYGVPLAHIRELVEYWRTAYDWRRWESRINLYPQFTTVIDGQRIHFLHVRSPEKDAMPLILSHGWPGSVFEFLDIIDPLSNPRENGGDPATAFDLIVPSLPGFAFSGPTTERGWDIARISRAWAELMRRVGYQRYGAAGNDWGSRITIELGRIAAESVAGMHVTQVWSFPSVQPADAEKLTEADKAALRDQARAKKTFGSYRDIQAQQPQTIAHALSDSPTGLLGWHCQIFRGKMDKDFVLTNLMSYWLTGTVASAMRIYYEFDKAFAKSRTAEPTTVPLGLAQFAYDFQSIRTLAEKDHKNIISWNSYDRPGHFAAHESPDLLVGDIRNFFAKVR